MKEHFPSWMLSILRNQKNKIRDVDLHCEANKVEALGLYIWHWLLPKVLDMIFYIHDFVLFSLKEPLKL